MVQTFQHLDTIIFWLSHRHKFPRNDMLAYTFQMELGVEPTLRPVSIRWARLRHGQAGLRGDLPTPPIFKS